MGGTENRLSLVAIAPGGAVGTHVHLGDAFSILEGLMAREVAGKSPVIPKPDDSGYVPL